jgi:membrane protein
MTELNDAADDGRGATRPSRFSLTAWRRVLARVWDRVGHDHLSIIAAGVAFYGVLSIFPAVAALIAIYGLVADPADINQSLAALEPVLPRDVYTMIEGQVEQIITAGTGALGVATLVSIVLALWTARAGVMALIEGLNIAYRETDTRGILAQYFWALALTVVLTGFAVVVLFAVVALPVFLGFSGLGGLGAWLAQVTPLLVLGCAMVFVIGGIYRYGPHRAPARKRWVSVGAVAATAGWVLVSLALSVYVSGFADFNKTYGSLGAIVGLMFWMYASVFVVLLGAELNASMELQTERDTTTGPPRPMGQRGAFVADHVA